MPAASRSVYVCQAGRQGGGWAAHHIQRQAGLQRLEQRRAVQAFRCDEQQLQLAGSDGLQHCGRLAARLLPAQHGGRQLPGGQPGQLQGGRSWGRQLV